MRNRQRGVSIMGLVAGLVVVIAFAYRKEVPLFGPVGLYIDYAANSKGGQ